MQGRSPQQRLKKTLKIEEIYNLYTQLWNEFGWPWIRGLIYGAMQNM